MAPLWGVNPREASRDRREFANEISTGRCEAQGRQATPNSKSENQFERELNLPWRIRATNRPEGRIGKVRIRRPEICPIEDVEKLGPELNFSSLLHGNRNGLL